MAIQCKYLSLQCNSPFYAGNGVFCAQDSDQDSRPDIELECTDLSCEMVPSYLHTCNLNTFILHGTFYRMCVH